MGGEAERVCLASRREGALSFDFDNVTGEGVVAFGRDEGDLRMKEVTVGGVRVSEFGFGCGTCGMTFKKVASPRDRVDDGEAARLLGTLEDLPPGPALQQSARVLPRGRYRVAVLRALVVPLHDPAALDRGRVEYWKRVAGAGSLLTAFAVAVLSNAMDAADDADGYEVLLACWLLDGHHRLQAAAETGVPARILVYASVQHSCSGDYGLDAALAALAD